MVKLGDGYMIPSTSMCKNFELQLIEFSMLADYYVFSLSCVDVILGVTWLETPGYVHANW